MEEAQEIELMARATIKKYGTGDWPRSVQEAMLNSGYELQNLSSQLIAAMKVLKAQP